MKERLFGTSGIRGVANLEVTPSLAHQIGLSLAEKLGEGRVVIGCDTRTSSQMLASAMVSGVCSGGLDATILGMIPTPTLAYLSKALHARTGVMITASHNPPEYNGMKLFTEEGIAYNRKLQLQIEKAVRLEKFKMAYWSRIGRIEFADESERYIKMITENVVLEKRWNVVVDPGCGAGSLIAPEVLRLLGCKVASINAQADGTFPGRRPEPSPENLTELSKIVRVLKADIGIAFDGDADRVVFIDERGVFLEQDRALGAFASHALEKRKGAIVVPVDTSLSVEETVRQGGGRLIRTKVGDVYIAYAVKKYGAVFGGEPCGAWITPEFHLCPDGILHSALFLKALEQSGQKPSRFISKVPKYTLLRRKIACPEQFKQRAMAEIEERLSKYLSKSSKLIRVDGLGFQLEDGWVLIRPSGTEPILRVTSEAASFKSAEKIMKMLVRIVENSIREVSKQISIRL
jgi:phosphoglucosamine mutase